jgi:hypothetical protein
MISVSSFPAVCESAPALGFHINPFPGKQQKMLEKNPDIQCALLKPDSSKNSRQGINQYRKKIEWFEHW